jgi:hypothetical protein
VAKLVQWLRTAGVEVTAWEGDPGLFGGSPDTVYLSVIFSWHAPLARDLALRYRAHADVACGGPGIFALATWWREQTGLACHRGVDARFEYQRGTYRMVFASRGCPVNCHFCLTPESVVITADGPKPIATLHVGELVLTHQGRYR